MLYDPKWEQQTKADPLSLEGLIAWLEKQPAWAAYDGCDVGSCMLFQWLQSVDPTVSIHSDPDEAWTYQVHGRLHDFFGFMDIALAGDNTFGAALERARAAL